MKLSTYVCVLYNKAVYVILTFFTLWKTVSVVIFTKKARNEFNIYFILFSSSRVYVCIYTIILRTKRSGHGKAHRRKNVMLLPSAILLMQMHTLPYESVHPSCVLRCNLEFRIYVWCFTIECSFKCLFVVENSYYKGFSFILKNNVTAYFSLYFRKHKSY